MVFFYLIYFIVLIVEVTWNVMLHYKDNFHVFKCYFQSIWELFLTIWRQSLKYHTCYKLEMVEQNYHKMIWMDIENWKIRSSLVGVQIYNYGLCMNLYVSLGR